MKIRNAFSPPVAVLPILLTLLACGSEEVAESPTPTSTPTATPVQFTGPLFQVSDVRVLPDGQGLDVDGNGTIDNALALTLDEISARMSESMAAYCADDACSAEDEAFLAASLVYLNLYLSPQGLEKALQTPLKNQEEYVYYQLNLGEPRWRMRWGRSATFGDYQNWLAVGDAPLEAVNPPFVWLDYSLPAHVVFELSDPGTADFDMAWNWRPGWGHVQLNQPSEMSSPQTLRMGGLLTADEFMLAFDDMRKSCPVCSVIPCVSPCSWFVSELDITTRAVLAEDLDGNGDTYTFGTGIEITANVVE